MKIIAAFTAGVVFLALASVAPMCAQDEHHDDAAPAAHQDEAKPKDEKAAKQDEKAAKPDDKAAKQDEKPAKQDEKTAKPDDKAAKRDEKAAKSDEKAAHGPERQQEAKPDDKDARHDNAAPAQANHGGGRIPDDKFRAKFGRQHTFRVSRPVTVAGQPRFQYNGYWFGFQQEWPSDWSYDDDCYIDYVDDGYYLFDPVHPGIRILVIVIS
jgi:hypothetical protein